MTFLDEFKRLLVVVAGIAASYAPHLIANGMTAGVRWSDGASYIFWYSTPLLAFVAAGELMGKSSWWFYAIPAALIAAGMSFLSLGVGLSEGNSFLEFLLYLPFLIGFPFASSTVYWAIAGRTAGSRPGDVAK